MLRSRAYRAGKAVSFLLCTSFACSTSYYYLSIRDTKKCSKTKL